MSENSNGLRYRAMRERIGLSREGLARILGVEKSTVWRRETGQSPVNLEHWLAIESVMMRSVFVRSDKVRSLPEWKCMGKRKEGR